ncbi:MAG: apolipoprotein N-acyltransferase [Desulfamplus sp.]|nr:apolipoprotein N-acyltransferase [Desulfamplus sp.]
MAVVKYFPSILSGTLLTLSFPKAHLYWLAWIALIPLICSLKKVDGKTAFYSGFITGIVHLLYLLYWIVPTIHTYGQIPLFLALPILLLLSFYLALYPAFFAVGVNSFYNQFLPLTAAAIWVSFEYLRALLFTGFPWGLLGTSQYTNITLIQIADITSVYGISFIIILTNGIFAMTFNLIAKKKAVNDQNKEVNDQNKEVNGQKKAVEQKKVGGATLWLWYIFLSLLLVLIMTYGKVRIAQIQKIANQSEHISLSVVQGNIEQNFKWDQSYQEKTIRKYCDLSAQADKAAQADQTNQAVQKFQENNQKPDLIVWPETALPFYYLWDKSLSEQINRCIQESNTNFLIGSPAFEIEKTELKESNIYKYFNRAYMVNPDGLITGYYDKIHLVPFGEYVPLGEYLSFLGKIIAQSGDFSSGDINGSPLAFHTLNGNDSTVGVLICFEIIFPYLSRNIVNKGAKILVNTTNDAWFGETSAPEQHFSIAIFRAIENRRAIARAANTGISGFIEPTGIVKEVSNIYVDAVLTYSMPSLSIETFYAESGDIFAITCLFAISILFVIYTIQIVKKRR